MSNDEFQFVESATPPGSTPPPLPTANKSLRWPAIVVLVGVLVISTMALWEARQQSNQVWRDALISISGAPPWQGVHTIYARKISDQNFPPSPLAEELEKYGEGSEAVELLGLKMRERIIATELSPEVWQSLTASGRPPEPGKHEVLAGQLCRLDTFTVDGETFTVVGRLQRGTAGLAFAYLLPYDDSVAPLFTEEAGATKGWLDPEGQRRDLSRDEVAKLDEEGQQMMAPIVPTTMPIAWGGMLGILLVVIGGALLQVRLLARFARVPALAGIIAPMHEYRRLLTTVHVLCYGALMGAALLAFAVPLLNLQVLTYVTEVFTTGDLKHLGAAYISGNIVSATFFTFWNNYVVQTLSFSIVPSLIVPFWGLVKTMLNLAIAGFALAPLWTNLLARFTYHSITLTLEVEAYVIAAFGICLYPIYIWRAFRSDDEGAGFRKIPPLILGTVVLPGLQLLFAAIYESITLIIIG